MKKFQVRLQGHTIYIDATGYSADREGFVRFTSEGREVAVLAPGMWAAVVEYDPQAPLNMSQQIYIGEMREGRAIGSGRAAS